MVFVPDPDELDLAGSSSGKQSAYWDQTGSGGGSDTGSYKDRKIGIDLLGTDPSAEPKEDEGILGVPGAIAGAVGAGISGLFNLYDTPNRIMHTEVAKWRIKRTMGTPSKELDDKYLNMINSGDFSVDEIADEMYRDGVAVTGGVPHDLILSIFADPMNVVMPAVGGVWQRSRRASEILHRMGPHTQADIMGNIKARTPLTADDEAFINKRLWRSLGTGYSKIGGKVGGAAKSLATIVFGRASSAIISALGVSTVKKISQYADAAGVGDQFDDALSLAAAHTTRGAAANHLVNNAVTRNASAIEGRISAVNRAAGKTDDIAREEFRRATSLDERAAVLSDEQIDAEFDRLIEVRDSKLVAGKGPDWAAEERKSMLDSAVAGEISEKIGRGGVINALDESVVVNTRSVNREVDDLLTYEGRQASVIVDQGDVAARSHFAEKLAFMLGREDAYRLYDEILSSAAVAASPAAQAAARRRMAIQAVSAANFMHLGYAARELSGNMASLRRMAETSAFLRNVDRKFRPLVKSQIGRMSIVGARTMTAQDKTRIIGLLEQTDDINQRRMIISEAIEQYDNLAAEFQIVGGGRLTVDDSVMESFMRKMDSLTDLPEEIPVKFTNVLDEVPEYQKLVNDSERLGYRLILEPEGAVTLPKPDILQKGSRSALKPRVSLWVPLTDRGMDVVIGNRTKMGKFVDAMFSDRSTLKAMQNTLDRMNEYAATRLASGQSKVLSMNIIADIHRSMMDYAFEKQGSLRTVALTLSGNGDKDARAFVDFVEGRVAQRGADALQEFRAMVKSGDFEDMIYYAAKGDLEVVGAAQYASGLFKQALRKQPVLNETIKKWVVTWTDHLYPKLKFQLNPIFQGQELVESKFFNALRGVFPEWRINVGSKEIRFGTKRYYDVMYNGKKVRLDAVKITQDLAIVSRPELKFAQDMAMLNQYFGFSATDTLLSTGSAGENFAKNMWKGQSWFQRKAEAARASKGNDFWLMTADSNIRRMADDLPRMFTSQPEQWKMWLDDAGGDARGAALLFLHQQSQLRAGRITARQFLERSKPAGFGFGRQFDDDPIKNLSQAIKEAKTGFKENGASAGGVRLAEVLGIVHAGAKAIGYSDESIAMIQSAIKRASRLSDGSKQKNKIIAGIFNDLDAAKVAMSAELEVAVARRKLVKDSLMSSLNIPQPMATEMASLYVAAQKRGEMLPELSLAVEAALRGERALDAAEVNKIADHLQAIREARTDEESIWNTIQDGIENQITHESMRVHFYNTQRSFAERTMNHVFFSLYPTSYMFGKVLPEYMRLLYGTRTSSALGVVSRLSPYALALKVASGGKFSVKAWTDFAPLTGFAAAYRARQAMVRNMDNDILESNPLLFFLTQTLIPGLPTDITVSANSAIVTGVQKGIETLQDTGNPIAAIGEGIGTGLYATERGMKRIGIPGAVGQAGQIVNQVQGFEGGPVEAVQQWVLQSLDSFGRFIRNE